MTASTNEPYRPGRPLRTLAGRRQALTIAALLGAVVLAILWQAAPASARPVIVVAALALPLGGLALRRRAVRAYNQESVAAVAILHRGDPARADAAFAAIRARHPWPRFLSRHAGFNQALARMRGGRFADAIAVLVEIDRAGGVIGMDGAIASSLAYLHALRGEVELAEAWLTEARWRDRKLPVGAFAYTIAELALAIRKGDATEILAQVADRWPEMENAMKGERLRPMRALRAFGVAQTGPRDAGQAAQLMAPLRGAKPDELVYLGAEWPELDRFLREHLASAAA